MSKKILVGPFSQIVTMQSLPKTGSLTDDLMQIVEGGGILIEGEKIDSVLNRQEFEQVLKKAENEDHHQHHILIKEKAVLVPGFVDPHTHICFAGSRVKDYARRLSGESYLEIAKQGGGILSTVRHTRAASEELLISNLCTRSHAHLLRGVTTCEVKSGYGLDKESELKMLRSIRAVNSMGEQYPDLVPTCLAAHMKPPEFKGAQQYLDYILTEILPEVQRQNLSHRVDIFIEDSAFTAALSENYLMKAKEMGFTIAVHADQFTVSGSGVAARVGAISADHLEYTTEEQFKLLESKGVHAIALPGSSLGLGEQFAPVRKMLDAGLSIAIASDWNPGSAPMGDLLTQAALLGANQKLSMAETLAGITVRAASALNLTDRGKLEPGYLADMVAFPCDSYEEIFYRQGVIKPSMVFHRGERVI